jgi:hypothetical protein
MGGNLDFTLSLTISHFHVSASPFYCRGGSKTRPLSVILEECSDEESQGGDSVIPGFAPESREFSPAIK